MKFAIILITSFLVLVLLILAVDKNQFFPKAIVTPSPSYLPLPEHVFNPDSPCTTERDKIISLTNNFENLQMKQDSVGVLKLFTVPISTEDINTLNRLSAQLYKNAPTNFIMPSYKITELPDEYLKGGCLLTVVEQRSMSDFAGYRKVKPFGVDIIVTKENGEWKIDKYFGDTQTPTKYSAWN